MPSAMASPKMIEDFNVDQYIMKFEKDLEQQLPGYTAEAQRGEKRKLEDADTSSQPAYKSSYKISYVGGSKLRSSTARFSPKRDRDTIVPSISRPKISSLATSNSMSIDKRGKKDIACPLYLSGFCQFSDEECNMLHTTEDQYMPHCYHYLNYLCTKPNCRYLHINLGQKAGYCQEFTETGKCRLGSKCDKYHVPTCETYKKYNSCQKVSCFAYHPGREVEPNCYNRGAPRQQKGGTSFQLNPQRLQNSVISSQSDFGLLHQDNSESDEKLNVPDSPSANKPYFGGPETAHDYQMAKIGQKLERKQYEQTRIRVKRNHLPAVSFAKSYGPSQATAAANKASTSRRPGPLGTRKRQLSEADVEFIGL